MAEITIAVDHYGWDPGDVISALPDNWREVDRDYDSTPPSSGGFIRIRFPLVRPDLLHYLTQPKRNAEGKVIQRRQWKLRDDLFQLLRESSGPFTNLAEAISINEGQLTEWFIPK